MKKYLYGGYNAIHWTEEIFVHKQTEKYGDIIEIIEIKMYHVPISEKNKEGISYSLVCIWNGERIIGFDNCEKHEKDTNFHHKHIRNKIIPYAYVDRWKLLQDFNEDVEKMRKGMFQ